MAPSTWEGPVGINEADLLATGESDGHAHNILFVHELHGDLDVERLDGALRWLGERHEAFRTGFVRGEAGWRRVVHARSRFTLEVIDCRAEPAPEDVARAQILALHRVPFDRATPPLLRVLLFRLAETRSWLVSHGDHTALDGIGFTVVLGELAAAYVALAGGAPPRLPPAPQPREHVAAVEARLAPVRATPGPWCAPYPADGFALRPDPSRPGGRDPAGARAYFSLGAPEPVEALARALQVPDTAPILAAVALGLRDLAARPDVGFTLIRSGRRDPASRRIVGCLAWGDAFAVRIDDDAPLAAVVARAGAFLGDDEPWRMLYVPAVDPPSRRIVLNVNRWVSGFELPGVVAAPRPDIVGDARMWSTQDVLVQVFQLPGLLQGVVRYRAALFEPATMERFATAIARALAALVADPATPARALT